MAAHQGTSLRRAIGQRLRYLRLKAGVSSQEKLGELAGVHRTYVGRLERGDSGVTLDMLAAVLAALGVGLAEFFRPFTSPVSPRTPRRRD